MKGRKGRCKNHVLDIGFEEADFSASSLFKEFCKWEYWFFNPHSSINPTTITPA